MKVLYTGSFNPFHNGHQYVYDLACQMFGKDQVWIGIGNNSSKTQLNTDGIVHSIHPITRNVFSYDCLTADVVKQKHFDLLIRGVRPGRSLEDENDLLYWNLKLGGKPTILIPTPPHVNQISSTAIRELYKYGKLNDVCGLISPYVLERWKRIDNPKDDKIKVYFGPCCCGKTTYLHSININKFVEFDREFWKYTRTRPFQKTTKKELQERLKGAFYDKDEDFREMCYDLYDRFDWSKFGYDFVNYSVWDLPNLGLVFNFIPKRFRERMTFIKVTTTESNRIEFAKARGANPMLVECNNHFYCDPPFWDEEISMESALTK